ncbi:LOW QUALITY PROTEIN: hypothetical protein PHMEG_00027152 [Phytophthora megakarya]|uniref:Integrase catalytic domain-containing protein n=1 Tax=Phytophthora megakarya TaxID=4795 RepID=A0A225V8K7_9STRA|nr:LOW QUALITY PROTEIN: hypothetical protein PHMEG_00027152 [Phytophthora megakarya]
MKVKVRHNLAVIETPHGRRVILPLELWAVVFKECHDSVWTFVSASYTVEDCKCIFVARTTTRSATLSCQECGSRKARPKEVIPPLRSLRGGDVGDRWALDVACPLPVTDGKQGYVIAAVAYVTRSVVCGHHNPEKVAAFLMKFVVLRFGPFRGTWKDCVATYMQTEAQNDWDAWVDFALYSYNSGRHTTVSLSPVMLGRKLRIPNSATDAQRMLENVNSSDSGAIKIEGCEVPGSSESESKLDVQTTKGTGGYENFLLEREDVDEHSGRNEQFIAHVSFLAHYNEPSKLLDRAAEDIVQELEDEDPRRTTSDVPTTGTVERSTTTPVLAAVAAADTKRRRTAKTNEQLVKLRRRRRRNRAGPSVIEFNLRPVRQDGRVQRAVERRWVSLAEYEVHYNNDRVVEDSGSGEGV